MSCIPVYSVSMGMDLKLVHYVSEIMQCTKGMCSREL